MELSTCSYMTIAILLSSVVAHPGHNLHHGANHFHQARQNGGAPFAGIEMLPTTGGSDSNTPVTSTVTQTSRLISRSSSSRPTGPVTYISVGTTSIGPIPITVIPVAIATICPPGVRPISTSVANTSATSKPPLSNAKTALLLPAEEIESLRFNTTGTNETSAVIPTFTAYDGSGCSTLYTRTSSAVCSTLLAGLGAIPVPVTHCEQSITFSTSIGIGVGCRATPAATNDGRNIGEIQGEPTAYFVAPWYDVADGQVPSRVLVQMCGRGMGGEACSTATESWSVVNQTSSADVTSELSFQGMVTGPIQVILGKGLFTTNVPVSTTTLLSVHTTVTTSTPTTVPSLSRSLIGATTASPTSLSSTALDSHTTTQSVVLEAISHTTVTVFQTRTSTIQRSVTVERNAATTAGEAAPRET